MIATQLSQIEKGAAKGLCLEFILHEYAQALIITNDLKDASPENALEILDKLYASTLNISILQQPGIIAKLCFYCEALVQNSKIGENLLGALDEMRNKISLLRTVYTRQISSIPMSLSPIVLLQSIQQCLFSFFSELLPVFQSSLECETALFALLELRVTFNQHLGPNTVETLLQNLFPDGPECLRQTLSNGFSRRGFSSFFKSNESLFEGLAWPQTIHINAPKL